jgi:hippurate hydrolase
MDALPVEEMTGLPYASKVRATDRDGKTVPVMHAGGHDMHVAWLVGATTLFAQTRDTWHGTMIEPEQTTPKARAPKGGGRGDRQVLGPGESH